MGVDGTCSATFLSTSGTMAYLCALVKCFIVKHLEVLSVVFGIFCKNRAGTPASFNLCREAAVVWYSMSFRSTGFAGVIFLMVLGCATNPSVSRRSHSDFWRNGITEPIRQTFHRLTSETPDWRAQKERQQRLAREAGRIGYIGNAGPALGTSLP